MSKKQRKNGEDLKELRTKINFAIIKNGIAQKRKKEINQLMREILDRHNAVCEKTCDTILV